MYVDCDRIHAPAAQTPGPQFEYVRPCKRKSRLDLSRFGSYPPLLVCSFWSGCSLIDGKSFVVTIVQFIRIQQLRQITCDRVCDCAVLLPKLEMADSYFVARPADVVTSLLHGTPAVSKTAAGSVSTFFLRGHARLSI